MSSSTRSLPLEAAPVRRRRRRPCCADVLRETEAKLAALCPSVWWITRFHAQEAVAGEAITVAFATEVIAISAVPDLLGGTDTAIRRSLQRLRAWMWDNPSQPPAGGGCVRGIRDGRGAMGEPAPIVFPSTGEWVTTVAPERSPR